jgi:hypothetical protein
MAEAAMSSQQQTSPMQTRLVGAGAAAFGLWLILVGLGVLPPPGGPRNIQGPLWLSVAAGLAFFLAGAAIVLQLWGNADERGELPPAAPNWMRFAQLSITVAIFVALSVLGSWVAFGPGARRFGGTFMFFSPYINEVIGRSLFGFGAVLCWLCTLLFAVAGFRRIRNRGKENGSAG